MDKESPVSTQPLLPESVIPFLPVHWRNNIRILSTQRAKLTCEAVSVVIETDELSVSVMIFISEKTISKNKSVVLPAATFGNAYTTDTINELAKLVAEWNSLAHTEKAKKVE